MEQEDYLKRQIDQLGRVLGKILADLTGLKAQGQASNCLEAADQALIGDLDLDIDEMISIPPGMFLAKLLESRKLNHDNIEKLAEILFLMAEQAKTGNIPSNRRKELLKRSLTLFEYADNSVTTYSCDRHLKIANIKQLIDKQGSRSV